MNVSLFERLVKNGMDCPVLNVQHRMRPEISCLISPLIYPDLENHESVRHFESIKGIKKNVFFVNHKEFEKTVKINLCNDNNHVRGRRKTKVDVVFFFFREIFPQNRGF